MKTEREQQHHDGHAHDGGPLVRHEGMIVIDEVLEPDTRGSGAAGATPSAEVGKPNAAARPAAFDEVLQEEHDPEGEPGSQVEGPKEQLSGPPPGVGERLGDLHGGSVRSECVAFSHPAGERLHTLI